MNLKRIFPFILSFVILSVAVYFAGQNRSEVIKKDDDEKPDTSAVETDEEMRGVWVTYMTLDTEGEDDPEQRLKDKTDRIIEVMKSSDLNTMIVQVRPFCDALYRSKVYPWSHIITGAQGEDPGFDPLQIICEKARENKIAVHAWVNPYRVKTADSPKELSDDNPYVLDPSIAKELGGAVYLDPSSEKARALIVEGVREIVENYAVDGVQFDDYFYPTADESFDREAYEAYKSDNASPLSLSDWRKENVNTLIREVYDAVHTANENAVFGISPQGNLKNNDTLFADVVSWCEEEGYVDYLCPQIYFSLDNPALTFEDGLFDWLNLKPHQNLRLYAGLACYKAGTDADEGTWLDNNDILKTEIEIIREKGLSGFMLYSFDSFEQEESKEELQNVVSYLISSPKQ